jgi:hypothetical protein
MHAWERGLRGHLDMKVQEILCTLCAPPGVYVSGALTHSNRYASIRVGVDMHEVTCGRYREHSRRRTHSECRSRPGFLKPSSMRCWSQDAVLRSRARPDGSRPRTSARAVGPSTRGARGICPQRSSVEVEPGSPRARLHPDRAGRPASEVPPSPFRDEEVCGGTRPDAGPPPRFESSTLAREGAEHPNVARGSKSSHILRGWTHLGDQTPCSQFPRVENASTAPACGKSSSTIARGHPSSADCSSDCSSCALVTGASS